MIVVTGATGNVGGEIVRALAGAGQQVRFYVDGTLDESVVHPTVEQITGRPPRTFREWAVDHAGRFR